MGMSGKEIWQQSVQLISARKKNSLVTILGLGLIFGLLLAADLLLGGIETSYQNAAARTTGGKVIMLASSDMSRKANPKEAQVSMTFDEMIHDLELHGGEIIGPAKQFGNYGATILPAGLVGEMDGGNLNPIDTSGAPSDAAPILISTFLGEQLLGSNFPENYSSMSEKLLDYETYRNDALGKTFTDRFGARYYVAGLASGNFLVDDLSPAALSRGKFSVLSPILRLIRTPAGGPIVIGDIESDFVTELEDTVVVAFADESSAYNYFRQGQGIFPNIDTNSREYYVDVIAGMSPEVRYLLRGLKNIIFAIAAILAVILVILQSINLRRRRLENRRLATKFHKLGATSRQISQIYICYFLELMLGATLVGFILASLGTILYSVINQGTLSAQYLLGFSLPEAPYIIYYGFGVSTVMIMLLLPLSGILTALINRKTLAKK